ncbi:MAG: glycosyltransferase 4 family protein [archaeon]
MDYLLLTSVFVSFILCLVMTPVWIQKCRRDGLLWEDMNKYGHPKNVAASGGIVVVMSFILGLLTYVALKTFLYGGTTRISAIFALLSMILILGVVGLVDDLFGWKNGGLSRRFRMFMTAIASIPLIVINAGIPTINLPFFGIVNFGILYPLVLIPVGVMGATTTYNFLAGFNGLETGQGILILSFLSYVAYVTGSPWLSIVGLCMVAALIAFYFYNKFPAKVFPGDIMTYSIGAIIAGMAILGNFEKVALIAFMPYFIEIILKLRGRLKVQSFGIPNKDNCLKMPFKKIYGLTHFSIFLLGKFKKNVYEKDVVYLIFVIQIIFILLGFLTL